MNITETQSLYISIWNMNGGTIPSETMKELTDAVEDVLKRAEDKNGTRLLYSTVIAPRDGE